MDHFCLVAMRDAILAIRHASDVASVDSALLVKVDTIFTHRVALSVPMIVETVQ
jgi:hypothetical protein